MSMNASRRSSWNGSEGTLTLSNMATHPGGGCVLLWLIQKEERTRHWQRRLQTTTPLSLRSPNQRVSSFCGYINIILCFVVLKSNVMYYTGIFAGLMVCSVCITETIYVFRFCGEISGVKSKGKS